MFECFMSSTGAPEWMEEWDALMPAIYYDEGGQDFKRIIYGSGSTASGPIYLIKPDKQFVYIKDRANLSEELENQGVEKKGAESMLAIQEKRSDMLSLHEVSRNDIIFDLSIKGTYEMKLLSLNGKELFSTGRTELHKGKNSVSLTETSLSEGVYLVQLSSSTSTEVMKVMVTR